MLPRRLLPGLAMLGLSCGTGLLSACGGGDAGSPAAAAPPPAAAAVPAPVTTSATSVDVSKVATSSGLAYDATTDATTSFTAPGGQAITVLIKGPTGITAATPCPGVQCYVMRALNPGETPDAYFPAAVQAAQAAHAQKLVIPQGTYTFQGPAVGADSTDANGCNEGHYFNCAPHWTIGTYPTFPVTTPDSVADLDIDLSGSVLNFAAPTTGIYILDAERIRLENGTLDWPVLQIASLGTIVADPNNPGHQALVLDDAYPAADALTGGTVHIEAVDVWDDSTDPTIAPGRFDLSAGTLESYFIFGNAPQPTYVGKTAAGNQTFSCTSCSFVNSATDATCSMFDGCANFDVFAVGTRVIVRHYTYNGFAVLVNWSNDVDLENIHILTGPGMGIAVREDSGFRGLRVADSSIKRAPGRLISTASDGINVTQLGGDVLIDGNEIAYQGDDAVNVSANSQSIVVNAVGNLSVTSACEPQPADLALSGDTLAFFGATGTYLGNATASTATPLPCGGTTFLNLLLACAGSAACNTTVAALTASDTYLDLTEQPVARFAVRNNDFHENRGFGTVANAPFGEITGNTFFRTSSGTTSMDAFGDLATANVVVSGNTSN